MTWTEHSFLSQVSVWKPQSTQQLDLEKQPLASHPGALTAIHRVSRASVRTEISSVVAGTNFQAFFFIWSMAIFLKKFYIN